MTHPVRAWTPALTLHLTNPCAKRKVRSLTKPKGKLYKTKFIGHYITFWHKIFLSRSSEDSKKGVIPKEAEQKLITEDLKM